jgi:hypothetical protein
MPSDPDRKPGPGAAGMNCLLSAAMMKKKRKRRRARKNYEGGRLGRSVQAGGRAAGGEPPKPQATLQSGQLPNPRTHHVYHAPRHDLAGLTAPLHTPPVSFRHLFSYLPPFLDPSQSWRRPFSSSTLRARYGATADPLLMPDHADMAHTDPFGSQLPRRHSHVGRGEVPNPPERG